MHSTLFSLLAPGQSVRDSPLPNLQMNAPITSSVAILSVSELSRLTVDKIKEYARSHGIQPPTVTKDKLIIFVHGRIQEKRSGIPINYGASPRPLSEVYPVYADTSVSYLEHLHKYGWATVAIPGWSSSFTNDVFTWLESCCSDFKRHDPSTWIGKNLPIMSYNVIKHYIGHTEFQWKLRELCTPIFAEIYQCQPDDLLAAFDGCCFLPNSKKAKSNKKNGVYDCWLHNDTPNGFSGFTSVQGTVNFVDNGPEDGGLLLLENSLEIYDEYMRQHPSHGIAWEKCDMTDPLLQGRKIKICLPAGHLALFDSRMFHCNIKPTCDDPTKYRMCSYVSMQPRSGASPKEIQERIKYYESGLMTGHWCYGPWFKNTGKPHTRGGPHNHPPTIEIAPLNPLRRRLVGYPG